MLELLLDTQSEAVLSKTSDYRGRISDLQGIKPVLYIYIYNFHFTFFLEKNDNGFGPP